MSPAKVSSIIETTSVYSSNTRLLSLHSRVFRSLSGIEDRTRAEFLFCQSAEISFRDPNTFSRSSGRVMETMDSSPAITRAQRVSFSSSILVVPGRERNSIWSQSTLRSRERPLIRSFPTVMNSTSPFTAIAAKMSLTPCRESPSGDAASTSAAASSRRGDAGEASMRSNIRTTLSDRDNSSFVFSVGVSV